MAELDTSAGWIDTGDFTPENERLDVMSLDELMHIRDVLEREAHNIEFQLDRSEGEREWRSTAKFAMKMRRHNAAILSREIAKREKYYKDEQAGNFLQRFVAAARRLLPETMFNMVRDSAIIESEEDMQDVSV